jgi:hypothetical protein
MWTHEEAARFAADSQGGNVGRGSAGVTRCGALWATNSCRACNLVLLELQLCCILWVMPGSWAADAVSLRKFLVHEGAAALFTIV